ncbi:hypothetical protein PG985_011295 [Apiospora marii]|uniref:Uncharacterized protein n=1 Tax=Apiospora marii TaxID=335849 RepID=A0ABR1SV25_9PEZI
MRPLYLDASGPDSVEVVMVSRDGTVWPIRSVERMLGEMEDLGHGEPFHVTSDSQRGRLLRDQVLIKAFTDRHDALLEQLTKRVDYLEGRRWLLDDWKEFREDWDNASGTRTQAVKTARQEPGPYVIRYPALDREPVPNADRFRHDDFTRLGSFLQQRDELRREAESIYGRIENAESAISPTIALKHDLAMAKGRLRLVMRHLECLRHQAGQLHCRGHLGLLIGGLREDARVVANVGDWVTELQVKNNINDDWTAYDLPLKPEPGKKNNAGRIVVYLAVSALRGVSAVELRLQVVNQTLSAQLCDPKVLVNSHSLFDAVAPLCLSINVISLSHAVTLLTPVLQNRNAEDDQSPTSIHRQLVLALMNELSVDDVLEAARLLRKFCKATWKDAQVLCNTSEYVSELDAAMFRDGVVKLRAVKKRNSLMKKRLRNERASYLDGRADLRREIEEIERDRDLIEDVDQWSIDFQNREFAMLESRLQINRHPSRFESANHHLVGITILGLLVLAVALAMGRVSGLESVFP